MRILRKLCFASPLLLLAAACARAEDVVTLTDGTVLKGKYIKEENGNVILKQPDGETNIIAKSRIRRMDITVNPADKAAMANLPVVPPGQIQKPDAAPVIDQRDARNKMLNSGWANPRIAEMEDLGSPELAKRKVAVEKATRSRDEYTLVILAMLNPKLKTAEYVRIGILRALIELKPLSDQAAQTLAYAAVADPYPEARREACRTIRTLQEDRAVRELVKYGISDGNAQLRYNAAAALNEIDDNRIYAALVGSIPTPEVSANYGDPQGIQNPKYTIPGPGGLNLPVWLPTQTVAGVASNIGSPVTDFLKMIAQKDMGNFPYAWLIWYREKIGEMGKDQRDSYKEKRSLRDKSNAP